MSFTGDSWASSRARQLSLDERLAALTARMQREEEEEQGRLQKQKEGGGGGQPSEQYRRFVDISGGQVRVGVDTSDIGGQSRYGVETVTIGGQYKSGVDMVTSGGQYREFLDTPGSPPDKSSPPQQSTMARRLREYRARFKVKPKPSPQLLEDLVRPILSPLATPSPCPSNSSPSPMPDLLPYHQPPPPLPQLWQCRICSNKVPSESLFQMHLTTTHFRERIMRRLPRTAPFTCLLCKYTPPAIMTDTEKLEDLLMHYGTAERVASKFYDEVCSEMDEQGQVRYKVSSDSVHARVECQLCDLSLDTDRSLLRHLTLRHFPKLLCDDLPKRFPFICPFIDCSQSRTSLHSLMLHYGVDHRISMEIYLKQKGFSVSQEFSCSGCITKPSFSSEFLYKQHIILTHLYPNLPNTNAIQCPKCITKLSSKSDFSNHFLSNHHTDLTLLSKTPSPQHLPTQPPPRPQCAVVTPYHPETDNEVVEEETVLTPESSNRVMRTVHTSKVARAKVLKNWEDSSLDAQKVKIGELENQMRDLEREHQSKLKEKQSEFERWILIKESTLEDEIIRRKAAEDKFATNEEDQGKRKAAEEKLSIQNKTTAVLQKTLSEKILENNQLTKDIKDLYRKLEDKSEELDDESEKLKIHKVNLQEITVRYGNKVAEVSDLQIIIQDRDDSLSDLQAELKKSQTSVHKIEKIHEKAIHALKCKNKILVKEIESDKKLFIDTEGTENLKHECDRFKEENSVLSSKVEDLELQGKEANDKMFGYKQLEKEKRELNKKVKQLSSTLGDWETRQFTNVKLIAGLEKERDTLAVKLKETQDGKLSHEDQLYWKNVEIKNRGKEIKNLTEKLDEFTKELGESKNSVLAAETELKNAKSMISDLENQLCTTSVAKDPMKNEEFVTNQKNEIMHLKMSLNQKKTLLSSMKSTALCQKTELDRLMTENEKFESDYSLAVAQLETLKNTNIEIDGRNKLKDEELRCLKNKLSKSIDREKVSAMLKTQQEVLTEKELQLKEQLTAKDSELSELEMMNQVLTDMDRNIFSKDFKIEKVKSCSNKFVIKEEPNEDREDGINENEFALKNFLSKVEDNIVKDEPLEDVSTDCLNMADQQIVLNIDDADILAKIKPEPEEAAEEITDPADVTTNNLTIAPWPAFVPLASHPELVTEKGKKRSLDVQVASGSSSKKTKSCLQDVTEQYQDQDTDEEVLCGICSHWDPPVNPENISGVTYTTEWVGCDCDRWFHKPCTKMKRFTDKFSCKSVKMKCLIVAE